MLSTKQIIDLVINPMVSAQYKVPLDDAGRTGFVNVYHRVLKHYTPEQLKAATTEVLSKSTYTPKPSDFVKAMKATTPAASGLIRLTIDDPGYWPWVEYKFPNMVHSFRDDGRNYNKLFVPTPLPPGKEPEQ